MPPESVRISRAIHQPDERQVILRFNQHHIVNMTKNTIHRLADIRIQVNRIDNLHLRVGMGYLGQRPADLFKTEPKAFAGGR